VPYLLHFPLIAPRRQAKQETKKTPRCIGRRRGFECKTRQEPIFIIRVEKLDPDKIEMYQFQVAKARRELEIEAGERAHPLHVGDRTCTRLKRPNSLRREYSLSPAGRPGVQLFCILVLA
jgi:hypothetical protein